MPPIIINDTNISQLRWNKSSTFVIITPNINKAIATTGFHIPIITKVSIIINEANKPLSPNVLYLSLKFSLSGDPQTNHSPPIFILP